MSRRAALGTAVLGVLLLAGCSAPAAVGTPAAGPSRAGRPALAACPAAGGPATSGRTTAVGPLTLPCLGPGPAVALDKLGGRRPVLVNLWASWCLPCQREMPRLQRTAALAGTRLLVLGVDTLDTRDSALSFLARIRATYPQLSDPDGAVRAQLRAAGLPATVLIGPAGEVRYRKLGELSSADLRVVLERAGVPLGSGFPP